MPLWGGGRKHGVGRIYLQEKSQVVIFRIKSIKDIAQYVIPHFCAGNKYPLLTQKRADFLLFKQVVYLVLRKEHLTSKGLLDTLSIKASLNLGLPDVLKKTFPNIVPKVRPIVEFKGIIDPQWLAGFADGESCFFVEKSVSKTSKSGYLIRLKVILSKNVRDVALLNSIKNYVNCGEVIIDYRGLSYFIVRKKNLILPTLYYLSLRNTLYIVLN